MEELRKVNEFFAMTVIVAIDYLTELLVIADARVSYLSSGQYDAKHGLQKLLPILSPDKSTPATLGFSGDVALAKAVFHHLLVNKQINNYQRPFIISQLKDDIERWIQEAVDAAWANNLKTKASFLFCAIEPKVERPTFDSQGNRIPSPLAEPFKECHIYSYTISDSGKVHVQRHQKIALIGSGKTEQEPEIIKISEKLIGFGRGDPNQDLNRAFAVMREMAFAFEDAASRTVGGAFQVVRMVLPPKKSMQIWRWLAGNPLSIKDVEITEQDEVITMKHKGKGSSFALYPIWHNEDWKPSDRLE